MEQTRLRVARTPIVQRLCLPRCQTERFSRGWLRMAREEPRKSSIDILRCKSTIRKQVHRHPQKHLFLV